LGTCTWTWREIREIGAAQLITEVSDRHCPDFFDDLDLGCVLLPMIFVYGLSMGVMYLVLPGFKESNKYPVHYNTRAEPQ